MHLLRGFLHLVERFVGLVGEGGLGVGVGLLGFLIRGVHLVRALAEIFQADVVAGLCDLALLVENVFESFDGFGEAAGLAHAGDHLIEALRGVSLVGLGVGELFVAVVLVLAGIAGLVDLPGGVLHGMFGNLIEIIANA